MLAKIPLFVKEVKSVPIRGNTSGYKSENFLF